MSNEGMKLREDVFFFASLLFRDSFQFAKITKIVTRENKYE